MPLERVSIEYFVYHIMCVGLFKYLFCHEPFFDDHSFFSFFFFIIMNFESMCLKSLNLTLKLSCQ